jgi:Uma2 family endonuclease
MTSTRTTPDLTAGCFDTPPWISIESLSPDDKFQATQDKIQDYLVAGVSEAWLVHPETRSIAQPTGQKLPQALHEEQPLFRITSAGIRMPDARGVSSVDKPVNHDTALSC